MINLLNRSMEEITEVIEATSRKIGLASSIFPFSFIKKTLE